MAPLPESRIREMDPVTIRILGPGDGAVLDNVADGVFDGPVDPHWSAEFFADPRHHLAVALDGDLVVGIASAVVYVHPDKAPHLWINEVGVAPTHQNRGIARRLVAALLEHGRALGCVEAWVATERSNVAAMRVYAAVGGKESPEAIVMYTYRFTTVEACE
jgi:GNAT superfamily N-acetyltransferase